jgi:hypothetical protein
MDFDHEKNRIKLTDQEIAALGTRPDVEWTISESWKLLELVEHEVRCVDNIDPSATPVFSERNRLIARKMQDGKLLQEMLGQLAPHAANGIGDEVERFLGGS